MREAGFSLGELKDCGYSAEQLLEGGFSIKALRLALENPKLRGQSCLNDFIKNEEL